MTITKLLFGVVAVAGMAAAQTQYITAKVYGIPGSSTLAGYAGQCEAQSWAFGAADQPSSNAPVSTAGRIQVSALVLTRRLDACSPKLFNYATIGQHISTITLTQSEPNPNGGIPRPVMVVTLSEALVSNYQIGGTAGDKASPPAESVSFVFTKITFEYSVYKSDGTLAEHITASYDVEKGY